MRQFFCFGHELWAGVLWENGARGWVGREFAGVLRARKTRSAMLRSGRDDGNICSDAVGMTGIVVRSGLDEGCIAVLRPGDGSLHSGTTSK